MFTFLLRLYYLFFLFVFLSLVLHTFRKALVKPNTISDMSTLSFVRVYLSRSPFTWRTCQLYFSGFNGTIPLRCNWTVITGLARGCRARHTEFEAQLNEIYFKLTVKEKEK